MVSGLWDRSTEDLLLVDPWAISTMSWMDRVLCLRRS